MRKSLLILVVALISLVTIFSCSFAASKFADVNGTKYETAVTNLNGKGIIDGFTDGSFRPTNSVTRAQICKLLAEALDLKKANNVVLTQFKDVEKSAWYYDYVKIAVDNGVIVGYQDGTFKPNNDVNYNELITMIIRAMGKEKVMTDKTWPSAYIAYASYYGLLSNVTYTDATQPAIRGEVSIALYNMLNRMEEETIKQETFKVMYGFVESTSTKSKVDYAKIDGTTYPVAYRSKSFTEDTFAVFEKSSLTDEITLGASYSVKDLDANADIVTYTTGKQGAQEIKIAGSGKYIDYFTTANINKYKSYGICVINVEPNKNNNLEVTKHSTKSSIEEVKFSTGDRIVEDPKTKVFLVFKGLDEDDKVTKGKYQAAVEYCKVYYKWAYSNGVSGIDLPKTATVEYGTRYYPTIPSNRWGYTFYFTNLDSASFVVKEDTTLYIDWDYTGGVIVPDEDEDQGGHAGSNMPLIDKVSENELKQALESALLDYFDHCSGIDVKKVKFTANGTDSVNLMQHMIFMLLMNI